MQVVGAPDAGVQGAGFGDGFGDVFGEVVPDGGGGEVAAVDGQGADVGLFAPACGGHGWAGRRGRPGWGG